ncbi:MAG: nosD [Ignavibacteria bacterium]|nr:nosD [Ignavibacteria bacterium]
MFSKLFIALMLLVLFSSNSIAGIIKIDKDSPSIAKAVALAKAGDTLLIAKGNYTSSGIKIDKRLSIIGVDYPEIDASSCKGNLFSITASGVEFNGLLLKNVPYNHTSDNAAIKFIKSTDCIVKNNKINNCFFGIYLANTNNCIISGNKLSSTGKRESINGNGIHLWHCNNIHIRNNKVQGHRDGIYFEFVRGSRIEGNESMHNIRYGLHFMFSDSCHYINNSFIENGAGVAVMYTRYIDMTGNKFVHNWGTASFGLLLKDIKDSRIERNTFTKNTIAVFSEGINRVKLEHNTFEKNGWALKILANCTDNTFIKNNFIGNTFDAAATSGYGKNIFLGNYWSRYKGYDINKDGAGDIPYCPVTLFSFLAEKFQYSVLLLHSLFVEALDIAEQIFPSVTPKYYIDTAPSMRMNK